MAFDWGSVPDWLSAFGGVGALVAAIVFADAERRRAIRAEVALRIERARAQNELPEAFVAICERALNELSVARATLQNLPELKPIGSGQYTVGTSAHNQIFRDLRGVFSDLEDATVFLQETRTHDVALRIASRDLRGMFEINELWPNEPVQHVLDWFEELADSFAIMRNRFEDRMVSEAK